MGAKAKQAIAGAERAIASMTKVVAKLESHFKSMYAQQGAAMDLHLAFAKYVQDTYPRDNDLTSRAGEDKKIATFMSDIAKVKLKAAEFKANCVDDLAKFTEESDVLIAAVNTVTALINAKRAKRNEPTKNVIKKLVNKAKTKSLGDLVAERAKVIAVINDIGPIVDQVKSDINFRNKTT